MSADWQASYQDPLRWRLPESGDRQITGTPSPDEFENDLCSGRLLVMHRPTNDSARDKSGAYPFSEHLGGRRRLWEIRLQLRFRQPPEGTMFFGIVLGRYVSVGGVAKQAQKALVTACSGVVGDVYHSNGDNPKKVTDREVEPPTFVMPLWAFDQFQVSNLGEEPDIAGNHEGCGMRRTEGASAYVQALRETLSGISPDKVYTFGFWGVSQFMDVMNWEVCGGLLPGMRMSFDKLCGAPPVYLSLYDLRSSGSDGKHFTSRKRQYFQVAVWSALRPPAEGDVNLPEPTPEDDDPEVIKKLESLDLLGLDEVPSIGAGRVAPHNTVAGVNSGDLLEFGQVRSFEGEKFNTAEADKKAASESVDLLGLG